MLTGILSTLLYKSRAQHFSLLLEKQKFYVFYYALTKVLKIGFWAHHNKKLQVSTGMTEIEMTYEVQMTIDHDNLIIACFQCIIGIVILLKISENNRINNYIFKNVVA